jgi:hypothetical protein
VSNTRTAKPRAKSADATLAEVQLSTADKDVVLPEDVAAKEIDGKLKVPLKGEYFSLADEINFFALMAWAASDEETSLQATFQLLQSIVAPAEWPAFTKHAIKVNAQATELGMFINASMEAQSGRPTEALGHS